MVRMFHGGALLSILAACATPALSPETSTVAAGQSETTSRIAGLPAQTLAPNECGLFLWSKTDTSQFVFFAKAGANDALFLLEGSPTQLRPLSQDGQIFGQFYTETTYATEAGREVSLSFKAGDELTDGARISNGTIQFADENGWRTVMPVLGVRACQPVLQESSTAPLSSDDLR